MYLRYVQHNTITLDKQLLHCRSPFTLTSAQIVWGRLGRLFWSTSSSWLRRTHLYLISANGCRITRRYPLRQKESTHCILQLFLSSWVCIFTTDFQSIHILLALVSIYSQQYSEFYHRFPIHQYSTGPLVNILSIMQWTLPLITCPSIFYWPWCQYTVNIAVNLSFSPKFRRPAFLPLDPHFTKTVVFSFHLNYVLVWASWSDKKYIFLIILDYITCLY